MQLRKKTLVIVGLTTFSLTVVLYIIARNTVLNRFTRLENQLAEQNVERVLRILSNEIGALDALAHNWAVQDETVAFLEAPASQYSLSNLTGIDVDIMLLADSSAQIVFSQAFDPQSERPTPMEIAAFIAVIRLRRDPTRYMYP